ncbi:MAG: hypothetical protein PSX80_08850, partial [bacterium]|nr:hypothetical protein [bacterium]
VGEVIGYTEPIVDLGNFRGKAIGLKMKPVETINFPHHKNDYIELFSFGHGTDCFPEVREGTVLPPIGTRFRMALFPATLVAPMSGSNVRLQSRVFDRISLDETVLGYSTNANSEFDYKNDLRPLVGRLKADDLAQKSDWLRDFLYIEASKDLLRLQRASSESVRMKILERLLYCPDINYARLLHSKVGEPLLREENDLTSLLLLAPGVVEKQELKSLPRRERELLKERQRLEKSGALNLW